MPRGEPGEPQPQGTVDPAFFGTTGLCLIPQGLRYLDSNRVWVIPFFHAFYYGVLKRLFEITFPVPNAAAHKVYEEISVQLPAPEYVHINPVMANIPEALKPSVAQRKFFGGRLSRVVRLRVVSCCGRLPWGARGNLQDSNLRHVNDS